MKLTGAQILAEVLIEQGATTVFGYPGGAVLNIYDALYENRDRIKHIMTAHEQGAAHAADGYARATGKTGVVIATSGPGATNLVTGIATAYMDSVPMVAITGNVSTNLIGRDSFQEVYIAGITMSVTKHNYIVHHVEDLADILREAFKIANTGRKGPVLVDIPKDITAAKCEFTDKLPIIDHPSYSIDNDILNNISDEINNAKRPVLLFGGGIISSESSQELTELIEKSNIPTCHTIMGTGVLSYDHPLNMGMVGMHGQLTSGYAMEKSDLIIAIGMRFSDRVALNTKKFANNAKIIHVDIDASEINKNVHIDYSIVSDAKYFLNKILPKINQQDRFEWMEQINTWQKNDYKPIDSDKILKPHQVMDTISSMAGEDAIIVTDVGQHQIWAAQYYRRTKPRSFLTSGGLGTMGFGYGAAIGAKVAVGDLRKVIHITGDGSFHMNLNEVCTAVSYNLPIITVIMNNTVLGMVRQWQKIFYNSRFSSTSPNRKTDYVKLAEAFGAKGFRANSPDEFKEAFNTALNANCPCIIDCSINKDENVLPMIPAGGTIDDVITQWD